MQEIVAHMARQAKQCGVNMVQVPVESDLSSRPFRVPVHISVPAEVDKYSLLQRFGFFINTKLDEHNYEFLHHTGVAFIRMIDDGFIWYDLFNLLTPCVLY